MSISLSCPNCGKTHSVKEKYAGKKAKCLCGAIIRVPSINKVEIPPPIDSSPIHIKRQTAIPSRKDSSHRFQNQPNTEAEPTQNGATAILRPAVPKEKVLLTIVTASICICILLLAGLITVSSLHLQKKRHVQKLSDTPITEAQTEIVATLPETKLDAQIEKPLEKENLKVFTGYYFSGICCMSCGDDSIAQLVIFLDTNKPLFVPAEECEVSYKILKNVCATKCEYVKRAASLSYILDITHAAAIGAMGGVRQGSNSNKFALNDKNGKLLGFEVGLRYAIKWGSRRYISMSTVGHVAVFKVEETQLSDKWHIRPGQVNQLNDIIDKYGPPSSKEIWKTEETKLYAGLFGIVSWWGNIGIAASDQGTITHVLVRQRIGENIIPGSYSFLPK